MTEDPFTAFLRNTAARQANETPEGTLARHGRLIERFVPAEDRERLDELTRADDHEAKGARSLTLTRFARNGTRDDDEEAPF